MTDFSKWHIYFGGSGFCCAFYIGVVKALQEIYKNQIPIITGDSAGSLIGLGYSLNIPWYKMKKVYISSLEIQNERNNKIWFGKISKDHNFILSSFFKIGNFNLIKKNDRFQIGLTKPLFRYEIVTNWEDEMQIKEFIHKLFAEHTSEWADFSIKGQDYLL